MTGLHPFVAIEGINGAGKSTIRDHFEDYYTSRGESVFLLGQYGWLVPSATATIVAFREGWGGYTADELLAAHVADRAVTYSHIIEPHLHCGPLVGDRCLVSDGPYIEALEGIPAEEVLAEYLAHGLVFPDVTLFVPVDTGEALDRIDRRGQGRKSYETMEILRRVNEAYERLMASDLLASATRIVRADGPPHELPTLVAEMASAAMASN